MTDTYLIQSNLLIVLLFGHGHQTGEVKLSYENYESIQNLDTRIWHLEKKIKELESHIVNLEEELKYKSDRPIARNY